MRGKSIVPRPTLMNAADALSSHSCNASFPAFGHLLPTKSVGKGARWNEALYKEFEDCRLGLWISLFSRSSSPRAPSPSRFLRGEGGRMTDEGE